MVGSIAKMRSTTKRSKKVESLHYTKFRGKATHYGAMEETAKHEYQTYQQLHGHPGLNVDNSGFLFPWMSHGLLQLPMAL